MGKTSSPHGNHVSSVSTTGINGNDSHTLIDHSDSSQRKTSAGRRNSKGLEILGIGTNLQKAKCTTSRTSNATNSSSRSPAPDKRLYKYWMMVEWSPDVRNATS